jgi:hypothetical protein
MTTTSNIPCKTPFTCREFEEYLFHREGVRLVIRIAADPDTPVHESTMINTSYFEAPFRAKEKPVFTQSNDMRLQDFVAGVLKTTDVNEVSIMLGDGTSADYTVIGRRSFTLKSSSILTASLDHMTLGDVRASYRRETNVAA